MANKKYSVWQGATKKNQPEPASKSKKMPAKKAQPKKKK